MPDGLEIRESLAGDLAAIEALYGAAFPDEDLLPLVRDLVRMPPAVLSLVAIGESCIAGHVAFTLGNVAGCTDRLALLGPLAVAPERQREGIGTAIVRTGLERLETAGATHVFVLGDPLYYGRMGFAAEPRVAPPYPLPEEWRDAWQSVRIGGDGAPCQGTLSLPPPWLRPALWAP